MYLHWPTVYTHEWSAAEVDSQGLEMRWRDALVRFFFPFLFTKWFLTVGLQLHEWRTATTTTHHHHQSLYNSSSNSKNRTNNSTRGGLSASLSRAPGMFPTFFLLKIFTIRLQLHTQRWQTASEFFYCLLAFRNDEQRQRPPFPLPLDLSITQRQPRWRPSPQ